MNLEDTGSYPVPPPGAAGDRGGERAPVFAQIRKALVTSRLTLGEADAGRDPYNSGTAKSPAALWRQRSRY